MPQTSDLHRVERLFNEKAAWRPCDISKRLVISRLTTHRHLNTLVGKNVVVKYDNGPMNVYYRSTRNLDSRVKYDHDQRSQPSFQSPT